MWGAVGHLWMHRLRGSIGRVKRMNCWSYYVLRCSMISGGAWDCRFNRSWSNSLPLMSKGEETQQRASIRQSEKEYFHDNQRKSIAINAKGGDYWKYCHLWQRMWQRNWHLNVAKKNRERMHLQFELQSCSISQGAGTSSELKVVQRQYRKKKAIKQKKVLHFLWIIYIFLIEFKKKDSRFLVDNYESLSINIINPVERIQN